MASLSRYLIVDKVGTGDATTIAGATALATAGGCSLTQPWIVFVNLGTYIEDVVLPLGCHLRGWGQYASVVNGMLTFHGGSTVEGFRISPPTADANDSGVRYIHDQTGYFGVMNNVNVSVFGNNSGDVAALRCSGAATGTILYVRNCLLYSANRYTGVATTARTVNVLLESDFQMYVEVFATHLKCSSGQNPNPLSTMVKVKCVAPATGFGYVHVAASDWEDVYGDGPTPRGYLLESVNTVHPGLLGGVSHMSLAPGKFNISMAYTGTGPCLYGYQTAALTASEIKQRYIGVDYPIEPVLVANRAALATDVAPPGAIWLRTT